MQESKSFYEEYTEKLIKSNEKIEKNSKQERNELVVRRQLKEKIQHLNDEVCSCSFVF